MSRYRFIEAEKHQHAISLLCRVLEVSRAALLPLEESAPLDSCRRQPGAFAKDQKGACGIRRQIRLAADLC